MLLLLLLLLLLSPPPPPLLSPPPSLGRWNVHLDIAPWEFAHSSPSLRAHADALDYEQVGSAEENDRLCLPQKTCLLPQHRWASVAASPC